MQLCPTRSAPANGVGEGSPVSARVVFCRLQNTARQGAHACTPTLRLIVPRPHRPPMDTAQERGIRLIAHGLEFYGSASGAELMTRLIGLMSEGEAWKTIAEAERIGMIEPVEALVEPRTPEQVEWRLVKGYDTSRLEMRA